MNDVLGLSAAVVLGSLTLTAFFLVVTVLFPRRVARTQRMAAGSPGRAFGVGLINLVFLAAVAFVFFALAGNTGVRFLALSGTVVLGLLLIGLSFGLAGMVQLVGERLAPAQGPTARSMWGALALSLACATPVVGWFALLPYAAITGLGAFVLSYLYGSTRSEASAPSASL
jgi:hypothetical protein